MEIWLVCCVLLVLKRKLHNFLRLYDPARLPEIDNILRDAKGEVGCFPGIA